MNVPIRKHDKATIRVTEVTIIRIFDEEDEEGPVDLTDYLNDYHNKGNE